MVEQSDNVMGLMLEDYAFSALMLLVRRQEGHKAWKNWVVGFWCGYRTEAR